MTIPRMRSFARLDVLPSYVVNRIQDALVAVAEGFRVVQVNNATVEVPAGAAEDAAVIVIDGRPRFNEATVQRAHPGGGAGTFDVWAVAADQNIVAVPDPNTDATNYAFDLRITAEGVPPTPSAGVVDIWTLVAKLEWDGTKITEVRNLRGEQRSTDPIHPTSPAPGTQALRARGAAAQTAQVLRVEDSAGGLLLAAGPNGGELRRTLATDSVLRVWTGAEAEPRLTVTAGGTLGWGSGVAAMDVNLYRASADILKTDDNLFARTVHLGMEGTSVPTPMTTSFIAIERTAGWAAMRVFLDEADAQAVFSLSADDGKLEWGAGGATVRDTNLYRSAAGLLASDSEVRSIRPSSGVTAFSARALGDTQDRFSAGAGGALSWGTGGATPDVTLYRGNTDQLKTDDDLWVVGRMGVGTAPSTSARIALPSGTTAGDGLLWGSDTNLYRNAANELRTDDNFVIGQPDAAGGIRLYEAGSIRVWSSATSDIALSTRAAAEAGIRSYIKADGTYGWGPGTGTIDATLSRLSANTLITNSGLFSERTSASSTAFAAQLSGDTNQRFNLRADGHMQWGAGGANLVDVNLYRQSADRLQTDDRLHVLGGPQPTTVAGEGTAASAGLVVTGAKGGNTTGVSGQTGGQGGFITLTAGNGGDAPSGGFNGSGGSIQLYPGAPGAGAGGAGNRGSVIIGSSPLDSVAFFGATPSAQRTGWGVALATNFVGAATRRTLSAPGAGYTQAWAQEVRDVLATLVDDIGRKYGLLGT